MATENRFHFNPETGKTGRCSATVKDCAFAQGNMVPEHYGTEEEARAAFESINSDKEIPELKKETITLSIDNDMGDDDDVIDAEIIEEPKKQELVQSDKNTTAIIGKFSDEKIEALDKKSEDWVKTITTLNPQSLDFEKHSQMIAKVGKKAFNSTAMLSTSFLSEAKTNQSSSSEKVGKDLTKLRNVMQDMVPQENDFKRKILGFLPGGNAVEKYFNRFESDAKQMEVIIGSLDKGQAMILQDNSRLDNDQKQLMNDLGTLEESELLLTSMHNKVTARIEEEKQNGNLVMANALEKSVLFNINQRRQDVATQKNVTIQSFMAMGITKENNIQLAQNIERTKTTSVTALATAARLAESLGQQRKMIDGINTMRQTTDTMMLSNAKLLEQNSVDIQKQAMQSSVSPEVLRESMTKTLKTLESIDNARLNANQEFEKNIDAMNIEVQRAKDFIVTRRQQQNELTGSTNNEFLLEE